MFQFIPQNAKKEERSLSDSVDQRVIGGAPPSYEDALDIPHDPEVGTIQQNQANQPQRQDVNTRVIERNQTDQTEQQNRRRRRRQSCLQKPNLCVCPRICWEFPIFITYIVGYFYNNAANNVRNHEAASECTYFPDLFAAWIFLFGAHYVFALVCYSANEEADRCFWMCAYWTVVLGLIILELIMVIHFFDIDDNCQEVVKSVGSNLFWDCMTMKIYYFLGQCSVVIFCILCSICCLLVCSCIGSCNYSCNDSNCCQCCNCNTTTIRSNRNHRRTHRSVQMTSNNNSDSPAIGGVYKFGGNQSVHMNLTNSTLTLSGNCKFSGSASGGNIILSGNSCFIGNIQNSILSLSGNSSVNGMVLGCKITASGNSSCHFAIESRTVVTSGNARVVSKNARPV